METETKDISSQPGPSGSTPAPMEGVEEQSSSNGSVLEAHSAAASPGNGASASQGQGGSETTTSREAGELKPSLLFLKEAHDHLGRWRNFVPLSWKENIF